MADLNDYIRSRGKRQWSPCEPICSIEDDHLESIRRIASARLNTLGIRGVPLSYGVDSTDTTTLFGSTISFALRREAVEIDGGAIPSVVHNVLARLEPFIAERGFARKCGLRSRIQVATAWMESGAHTDPPSNLNTHDVMDAFKGYLRSLREPVVPEALYPHFVQVAQILNDESLVQADGSKVTWTVAERRTEAALLLTLFLPRENLALLRHVMRFFRRAVDAQLAMKDVANTNEVMGFLAMSNILSACLFRTKDVAASVGRDLATSLPFAIMPLLESAEHVGTAPNALAVLAYAYAEELHSMCGPGGYRAVAQHHAGAAVLATAAASPGGYIGRITRSRASLARTHSPAGSPSTGTHAADTHHSGSGSNTKKRPITAIADAFERSGKKFRRSIDAIQSRMSPSIQRKNSTASSAAPPSSSGADGLQRAPSVSSLKPAPQAQIPALSHVARGDVGRATAAATGVAPDMAKSAFRAAVKQGQEKRKAAETSDENAAAAANAAMAYTASADSYEEKGEKPQRRASLKRRLSDMGKQFLHNISGGSSGTTKAPSTNLPTNYSYANLPGSGMCSHPPSPSPVGRTASYVDMNTRNSVMPMDFDYGGDDNESIARNCFFDSNGMLIESHESTV